MCLTFSLLSRQVCVCNTFPEGGKSITKSTYLRYLLNGNSCMRQSLYSFKSPYIDVWTTGCQNETKISCVQVDLPSPENNVGRSDFFGR